MINAIIDQAYHISTETMLGACVQTMHSSAYFVVYSLVSSIGEHFECGLEAPHDNSDAPISGTKLDAIEDFWQNRHLVENLPCTIPPTFPSLYTFVITICLITHEFKESARENTRFHAHVTKTHIVCTSLTKYDSICTVTLDTAPSLHCSRVQISHHSLDTRGWSMNRSSEARFCVCLVGTREARTTTVDVRIGATVTRRPSHPAHAQPKTRVLLPSHRFLSRFPNSVNCVRGVSK